MPIGARLIKRRAIATPTPSIHPDITSWVNRVTAAGGTVRSQTIDATNTFVKWAYENNYRASSGGNHKILFWIPLATDDFNGLFIPIWHPQGQNGICVNNGFTAANYSRLNGLTGNAANYIASGVMNSDGITASSVFFAADHLSNASNLNVAIGIRQGSAPWFSDFWLGGSNNNMSAQHPQGSGSGNAYFAPNPSSAGLGMFFRDGTAAAMMQEGSVLSSNPMNAAQVALTGSAEYYLFGRNNVGSGPQFQSPGTYRSFMIGKGFTSVGELSALSAKYAAMRSLVRS